jgi:hypothetical protein
VAEIALQFTDEFGDARVEELKLLSWINRHGELSIQSIPSGPRHDMLLWLLSNDLETLIDLMN